MTSLADLAWPRRTERLVLRPVTVDDVGSAWSYRRLAEVSRWISSAEPDLVTFRERFTEPHRLTSTLMVELGGAVVGDLMVRVEDAWAQAEVREQAAGTQAELGWSFSPSAGGRGYATEAVRELLTICFDDLGLRRVQALCFADNEPSWRLMERLGMRRESHNVRESLHRDLGWVDGLGYALLADEWREQHGGR